jgi:hypothetical protein
MKLLLRARKSDYRATFIFSTPARRYGAGKSGVGFVQRRNWMASSRYFPLAVALNFKQRCAHGV